MSLSKTDLLERIGYPWRFSMPLEEFERWIEKELVVETFDDDGNPVRTFNCKVEWGHSDSKEPLLPTKFTRVKKATAKWKPYP